jgi:type IX secretion system PorP/SprF family membrane protein
MSLGAFAQHDILLTQQWFSRINRNPASTGNSDYYDLFLLTRRQWTGVDNMPQSNLLNVHSYFENIRSGVGLSLSYDNPGGLANAVVNAKIPYAYHLNLKEDLLLSLGVSAGILYKSFDPTKHVLSHPDEFGMETFPSEKEGKVNPDFDFGAELSMPKLLVGASVTHLGMLHSKVTTYTSAMNFYGYARGNFVLNENFDIAPSVVYLNYYKVNLITIGANVFYKKMIWAGIDYRPPSPRRNDLQKWDYSMLTAMIGIEYNFFRIGYAYDLSLSKLNDLSYSTHELMLSFRIPNKANKYGVRFMQ